MFVMLFLTSSKPFSGKSKSYKIKNIVVEEALVGFNCL